MHDAGVSVEKYDPHRFLMGVMMGRQPIVRDPKNYKYYIPYDMVARTGEPGKEFFPEYISGNLRISNPGTGRAIAEAARVVRFLWLEDVWLTGYIAQYLHIQHLVGILLSPPQSQNPSCSHVEYFGHSMKMNCLYKRDCRTQAFTLKILLGKASVTSLLIFIVDSFL